MTTRTRYFVIVSLLVLAVGVGTGLVAYYVGLSPSAFAQRGGIEELRYLPRNPSVVAYADVHEVMTSELRQHLRHAVMQMQEDGQSEFQNETGINIETDIDRVVACLEPDRASVSPVGMVLARGRFDEVKIEALMRERGAQVENYKNNRLIVADHLDVGHRRPAKGGGADNPNGRPTGPDRFALSFLEPGLVVFKIYNGNYWRPDYPLQSFPRVRQESMTGRYSDELADEERSGGCYCGPPNE